MEYPHLLPEDSLLSNLEQSLFENENNSTITALSDDTMPDVLTSRTLQTSADTGKIPVPEMVLPSAGTGVKSEAPVSQSHAPPRQPASQSLPNLATSKTTIAIDKVHLRNVNEGFAYGRPPTYGGVTSRQSAPQLRTTMEPPPVPVPVKPQGLIVPQTAFSNIATEDAPQTNDNGLRPQHAPGIIPSIPQDVTSSIVETGVAATSTRMMTPTTGQETIVKAERDPTPDRAAKPRRPKPEPFKAIPVLKLVDLTIEPGETSQNEVPEDPSHRGESVGPRAEGLLNTPAPVDRSGSPTGGLVSVYADNEGAAQVTPVRPTLPPRAKSFHGFGAGTNDDQLDDLGANFDESAQLADRQPRPAIRPRVARTPGINDIELVHTILDGKFRRAQQLEDELAEMQAVIFNIDDKLGSIFDRDQSASKLRDRSQRLQDALNEHRDKYARATEEASSLRFQLQAAHDELKRTELSMGNQLAREGDKLALSAKIIRQLKAYSEANRESLLDLEHGYRNIKAELAAVVEEKAKLKARIRERDDTVENMKSSIEMCQQALQGQREKYEAIRDRCINADAIFATNNMLRIDLDNTRSDLNQERETVISLQGTLKSMAIELEALRSTMCGQHETVTSGVDSTTKTLHKLIESQQREFQGFRDGVAKLRSDCEDPESDLFKRLDVIIAITNSKWMGVNESMLSLHQQHEKEVQGYSDKVDKWKALKETLTGQIQDLTSRLSAQKDTINALTQEKHVTFLELEKQRELNKGLVETTSKENELHALKLTELSHKTELLEGSKREYLVKNSLLESTLRTVEAKVEAEKQKADAQKREWESKSEKQLEDLQKLQEQFGAAQDKLGEQEQMKGELQQATQLAADLKGRVVEEKAKSDEAKEEVRTLREELQIKDEQLSLAATRWADTSAKQTRLEEIASAAKAEAQLKAEETQAHREKVHTMKSRVAELEAESTKMSTLLKKVEADIESSKTEVKGLSKKLGTVQESLDQSKQLCEDQRIAIEGKDTRISKLEEMLEAANEKIKSLEVTVSEQSKAIEDTKAELKAQKDTGKQSQLPEPPKSKPKKKILSVPLHHSTDSRVTKLPQLRRSRRVRPKISSIRKEEKKGKNVEEEGASTANEDASTKEDVTGAETGTPQSSDPDATQQPTPTPQSTKRKRSDPNLVGSTNPVVPPNTTGAAPLNSTSNAMGITVNPNFGFRKKARVKRASTTTPMDLDPPQSSPQAALTYNAAKQKGTMTAPAGASVANSINMAESAARTEKRRKMAG
ncbi:hypothetical protein TWF281_000900 [Arthrobotrys megalospora]